MTEHADREPPEADAVSVSRRVDFCRADS